MEILEKDLEKDIISLCAKINMPQEVTDNVVSVLNEFDFNLTKSYVNTFLELSADLYAVVGAGDEMVAKINDILDNCENKGFIWLTLYLIAAVNTKKAYAQKGISDEIYYDTMAVFTRFAKEHFESYGYYGYDRAFWNYRQTAMTLFRIGALEYEMTTFSEENVVINSKTVLKKGDNIISIHIPSDAKLSKENCKASINSAKGFFEKYYSEFSFDVFWCSSWIISPSLKEVLPPTSNIVHFIDSFEIYNTIADSNAYVYWVFNNSKLSIDEYPQKTSLQRNIVKHIKQGGKIGVASGIIRKENC